MHPTERDLQDLKHDLEALSRFTSGRWLWGEHQQLTCCYVKFDMPNLLELAASTIGSKSCVHVVKISEGQYNKVLLLTMSDGREVIAKLPNPNAGRPHFTTATLENSVGAEYIIMEKHLGVMLSDVWGSMKKKQKTQIVLQVADIEKTLASTKFTKLGALYYKNDLPATLDTTIPLYVDRNRNKVHSANFGIGPTTNRLFCDFGRGDLDTDRGPLLPRVYTCGVHDGHCVLRDCLCKGRTHIPIDARMSFLRTQTIQAEHFEKTLRIEQLSQSGAICSTRKQSNPCISFMAHHMLRFLDYNGPAPGELQQVCLPANFDSMTPHEQQKAKALHCIKHRHYTFFTWLDSVKSTRSLPGHAGSGFTPSPSYCCPRVDINRVRTMPQELAEGCGKRVAKDCRRGIRRLTICVPCLLQFSGAEVQQQGQDEELWARGVELMNNFISDTGCFKHWDGRVSDADYELSKRQLADGIARVFEP
ncbi:phosphotransferase enzyme family protein [Blastomyces gilchristii SLH14081]|uniref:Altered inheritance of mitochondria protein 9, mitochondrial n=1 Tax=Blastomyces gilchristii (strain SLH14081) TaxID=559298 RepID=A0A179V4A2_BLAGS|nr:phosphotransferase enzyme family protein [Blastomyces gilchristii SLH14081]OAT14298.1 phosphotransferase enzyme family protein [Blastomyces gilchristii SLH14081]